MRNGRSIGVCGAANPEPRILHAELALFVRLRHLSVSPTGERASNAPQAKIRDPKDHRAQTRAGDSENRAAEKDRCEEDGGPQEETGTKGSETETAAGKD